LTLLEVVVSASILAIAMVGLVSALLSSMRLRELNKERAVARNAAEKTLSSLRGMGDIVGAYTRFGGGQTEETFDVTGLADPAPGQSVGRVIIWRQKHGNPPDPNSPIPWPGTDLQDARTSFGMAFPLTMIGAEGPAQVDYLDTNLDGFVNGADTPSLMPVTVRVRWRSRSGVITEYFSTVIGRR
jgi:type II secretory pathway pseudopilin PulG